MDVSAAHGFTVGYMLLPLCGGQALLKTASRSAKAAVAERKGTVRFRSGEAVKACSQSCSARFLCSVWFSNLFTSIYWLGVYFR